MADDNIMKGEPGTFGSGGDPIETPKDLENKDGMLASPMQTYPAGAEKGGGAIVKGPRLGRG